MSDLIERQAAIDVVREGCQEWRGIFERCKEKLLSLPSGQPETAKRIVGKSRSGMTMWYQCDMCNEPVDEKDTFCRGCGRRFVNG